MIFLRGKMGKGRAHGEKPGRGGHNGKITERERDEERKRYGEEGRRKVR